MSCCGDNPNPLISPTSWPCTAWVKNEVVINDANIGPVFWEGDIDVSTVEAARPSFSPIERPAVITLTRIREQVPRASIGFPASCFDAPPECHERMDVNWSRNWFWMCKAIKAGYTSMSNALKIVRGYVPCVFRAYFEEFDDTAIPGFLFAATNEWNILVIPGTNNVNQFVFQAIGTAVGLDDFGNYSTLQSWEIAKESILTKIRNSGVPIRDKWLIMGHSYGGVIASLMTATVGTRNLHREIRLFTIGSPVPGDERLQDILADHAQAHLQNAGDPVPSFPPAGVQIASWVWLLTTYYRNFFSTFANYRTRYVLEEGGNYRMNEEDPDAYDRLQQIISDVQNGYVVEVGPYHASETYQQRCQDIPE